MKEESLRRSWDANARAWTRSVRGGEIESRRVVTDDAVIAAVLDHRPRRVLDVGSGEGWLARSLAGRGVEVVGFDGSAELVTSAREAGGGAFHHVDYDDFAADPRRWGADFDVVVCNFSLLGETVRPLLRACARTLRPGGRFVVQTVHPFSACGDAPYEDGWRQESFDGLAAGFRAPMPWYFRTMSSWIDEVVASGFALVQTRETVHPETGAPLSLILVGSIADLT